MKLNMFDYQRKSMNAIENIVICNWARNLGKTYTLCAIILENKPSTVLYVGRTVDDMISLKNNFTHILNTYDCKQEIKSINYSNKTIIIEYVNGEYTYIYNYSFIIGDSHLNSNFDYIMFNDSLPIDLGFYKGNKIISMITINNYNHKLEKLYGNNVKVFNCDYRLGIKYKLLNEKHINSFIKEDFWYDEFAIMYNPYGMLRKTAKS